MDDNNAAVFSALRAGNLGVIRSWLSTGADANIADVNGW
jgi:hypothetical protein